MKQPNPMYGSSRTVKFKDLLPVALDAGSAKYIADGCLFEDVVCSAMPAIAYLASTFHEFGAIVFHLAQEFPDFPKIPDSILDTEYQGDGLWDKILIIKQESANGPVFTFIVINHQITC